jgi:uncharacterized membrane protein
MSAGRAPGRRIALVTWFLLAACVAAWPWAGGRVGPVTTAIAFLPLLVPIWGLVTGASLATRSAPMAIAPALALALTEALVNPAARLHMALCLVLLLGAFVAILPAVRQAPKG